MESVTGQAGALCVFRGSRKLKYLHGRPGLEIVPEPVLDRFIEYGLLYSKIYGTFRIYQTLVCGPG